MYQDYKLSAMQAKVRDFFMKWLYRETRREIILHVSVSEAKDRLQKAFNDTLKVSGGFLAPTYLYTGKIVDDTVDIQCSFSGRSITKYSMHGELFPHQAGSRLLMVIKDDDYWSLIGIPLFLMLITLQLGRDRVLLFIIVVFGLARQRLVVEDNMIALLSKIINNNF